MFILTSPLKAYKEIASINVSVQQLFPLPVSWPTLEFPMSGRVGNVISKSGMVENVGVAVGIALPSVTDQKLFPLPVSTFGFVADILGYRYAPIPGLVGSAIPM